MRIPLHGAPMLLVSVAAFSFVIWAASVSASPSIFINASPAPAAASQLAGR